MQRLRQLHLVAIYLCDIWYMLALALMSDAVPLVYGLVLFVIDVGYCIWRVGIAIRTSQRMYLHSQPVRYISLIQPDVSMACLHTCTIILVCVLATHQCPLQWSRRLISYVCAYACNTLLLLGLRTEATIVYRVPRRRPRPAPIARPSDEILTTVPLTDESDDEWSQIV